MLAKCLASMQCGVNAAGTRLIDCKFEHEFDKRLTFKQHVRYNYLNLKRRYLDIGSIDKATMSRIATQWR